MTHKGKRCKSSTRKRAIRELTFRWIEPSTIEIVIDGISRGRARWREAREKWEAFVRIVLDALQTSNPPGFHEGLDS